MSQTQNYTPIPLTTGSIFHAETHATHGIAKLAMPSETWQIVFSIIGAIAIGVTTLLQVTGMAPRGQWRTSAWWERSWPVGLGAAEAHGAGPERGT